MNKLKLIKVSPEKALEVIRECAVDGYNLLEQMIDDVDTFAPKYSEYGDVLNLDDLDPVEYKKRVDVWVKAVQETLGKIYVSEIESKRFGHEGNYDDLTVGDYRTLMHIRELVIKKITLLESYIDFIYKHFEINISAGRDVNLQSGDNSEIRIENKND